MRLSVYEGYFRKIYGSTEKRSHEQAIVLCREGGFDTVAVGLGGKTAEDNLILRDDPLGEAQRLRDYCDGLGVAVEQTHARFDFKGMTREQFVADMIKTVQVSKLLGADTIAVHADTYYDPEYRFDFDTVRDVIYDIYAPMVEEAKKQGVRLAMETLFEDRAPAGKRARFTSTVEELDAIVSKYNDPIVGICWDFGHARVVYGDDQFEQMKRVGDKIISTHVHDNVSKKDVHSLPFLGGTDWETGLKTLKAVGYQGDLTLELVYGCMPEDLLPDYLKLCHKVGSYMVNVFDK